MTAPTDAGARVRSRPRRSARAWAWSAVTTLALAAVSVFALLAVVVPALLGAQTYTVLTGSMRPALPPGSLIGVVPVDFDDIDIGDVITFQRVSGDPAVVTHRVIGFGRTSVGPVSLLTQGDANGAPDARPVIPDQVRGIVVYAVPFLGYPGALVGGQTRSALVIGVGLAIIAAGLVVLVRDLVRSRRTSDAAPAQSAPRAEPPSGLS